MDLHTQLTTLKKRFLKKISDAALEGNTARVSDLSAIVTRIEDDERQIAEVSERAEIYEKQINSPAPSLLSESTLEHVRFSESRKGLGRRTGREAREQFIKSLGELGYRVTPKERGLYQTPAKKSVVIPFANEQKPSRWFLGIQDAKYDVVILLCKKDDGKLCAFVLPRDFLDKFWDSLSRSHGQVKFNVLEDGGNYHLLVPGRPYESVSRFLDAYGPIKY